MYLTCVQRFYCVIEWRFLTMSVVVWHCGLLGIDLEYFYIYIYT